jgi:hypothetical protein
MLGGRRTSSRESKIRVVTPHVELILHKDSNKNMGVGDWSAGRHSGTAYSTRNLPCPRELGAPVLVRKDCAPGFIRLMTAIMPVWCTEAYMRKTATISLTLAALSPSSFAEYGGAWCAYYGSSSGGTSCGCHSWEQCMAAFSNNGTEVLA